jgi:bacillithiol synthase
MAEKAKMDKGLEHIEQKMIRAEKRKQEQAVSQIAAIKDKLFPGNGLQERIENFLPFYVKYGEAFIDNLVERFTPMQKSFVVLSEE